MNNTFDKILKAISTCILCLIVSLAILLVGVRLVGFDVYTVLSGSMEPKYHTGSLLYVRETDVDKLEGGDIITFKINGSVTATHRIIELVPDENDAGMVRFKTKGDANDSPDGSLVDKNNVVGKPVFSIPMLGYLAAYIQQPPGLYLAIVIGAVLIGFVFLADYLIKENNKEMHKEIKK